jgi:U4/U6.U5 tri-snRNP component SNU23
MSGKATALGGSGVGPNRRKWDVEEFSEKARERDREEKERAIENEERIRKGQKPLHRNRKRQDDLPKPTDTLKARENDLEIDKNQGKTLMVDNAQSGRRGPGFYCEVCNRTYKDSIAYLDHVNGRQRECSGWNLE